jgi:hypothetical protein
VVAYSFGALVDFHQYKAAVHPKMELNIPRFHYFLNNRVRKTWVEFISAAPLTNDQSTLKTFSITVDQKDIEQLNANLPDSGKRQFFKAYMKVTGEPKVKKIKLRYRGDNNYHWLYDKKSLRIKLMGSVYDMEKTFNLINPVEMSSYRDVVNYAQARKLGLLAPDCYPVRVKINGRYMGVYLYVSQVDESLLRKNKRMPGSIYYGDLGVGDKGGHVWDGQQKWQKKASRNRQQKNNRQDISLLIKAINEYTPAEFIQFTETYLNKSAFFKFIALDRLFGSHHHDFVHNHKIYFDPYKGKFEPIAWDIRFWTKEKQKDRSLHPIQLKFASYPPYDAQIDKIVYRQIQGGKYKRLLSDYQAVVNRILPDLKSDIYRDNAAVVKIFSNKAVSSPFSIEQFERRVHADKAILTERVNYLKKLYQQVNLTYSTRQISDSELELNFRVAGNNPVVVDFSLLNGNGRYQIVQTIKGLTKPIGESITLYPGRKIVTGSQTFLPVAAYGDKTVQEQSADYQVVISTNPQNVLNDERKIVDKLKFFNYITDQSIQPINIHRIDVAAFAKPSAERSGATKKANNIEQVTLSGNIDVTTSRTYYRNTRVHIKPGTRFIMYPQASIFFYGQVIAEGTASQPIVFSPKYASKPWGVVAVQGPSASGSRFSYCEIQGGSIATNNLIDYTAPLNLHDLRNFSVQHCKIGQNHKGDDAMHIAYAQGVIQHNEFRNARSDALDIDIAQVSVNHNQFYNSGNDALDIMTTTLQASHNIFINSGDKAISIGEWSNATITKSLFEQNTIAIEVKDQSTANLSELLIKNSKNKAINLYHKNKRYSKGGEIAAHKIALVGNNKITVDKTSFIKSIDQISEKELKREAWLKELQQ